MRQQFQISPLLFPFKPAFWFIFTKILGPPHWIVCSIHSSSSITIYYSYSIATVST